MIKIRKINKNDFADFCKNEYSYNNELRHNVRFGMGTYRSKLTEKKLKGQFFTLLKNIKLGKQIVLVAEEDGSVIGMCEATPNAWVEAPHIVNIGYSVVKEHRGEGVGSLLLKELLKLCRKKYEIATAGFFSNNTASRKLLEKFGFKRCMFGPRFVKRGNVYMNSEVMYLNLK